MLATNGHALADILPITKASREFGIPYTRLSAWACGRWACPYGTPHFEKRQLPLPGRAGAVRHRDIWHIRRDDAKSIAKLITANANKRQHFREAKADWWLMSLAAKSLKVTYQTLREWLRTGKTFSAIDGRKIRWEIRKPELGRHHNSRKCVHVWSADIEAIRRAPAENPVPSEIICEKQPYDLLRVVAKQTRHRQEVWNKWLSGERYCSALGRKPKAIMRIYLGRRHYFVLRSDVEAFITAEAGGRRKPRIKLAGRTEIRGEFYIPIRLATELTGLTRAFFEQQARKSKSCHYLDGRKSANSRRTPSEKRPLRWEWIPNPHGSLQKRIRVVHETDCFTIAKALGRDIGEIVENNRPPNLLKDRRSPEEKSRDRWLREKYEANTPMKDIIRWMSELSRDRDWNALSTDNGVRKALRNDAKLRTLAPPVFRNRGRPKKPN